VRTVYHIQRSMALEYTQSAVLLVVCLFFVCHHSMFRYWEEARPQISVFARESSPAGQVFGTASSVRSRRSIVHVDFRRLGAKAGRPPQDRASIRGIKASMSEGLFSALEFWAGALRLVETSSSGRQVNEVQHGTTVASPTLTTLSLITIMPLESRPLLVSMIAIRGSPNESDPWLELPLVLFIMARVFLLPLISI